MHFSKNVRLYGRMNKFRYYTSIALLLFFAMPSPVLANCLNIRPCETEIGLMFGDNAMIKRMNCQLQRLYAGFFVVKLR